MFLSATASQLVARKEQGALSEKGSNHHGVPCVCVTPAQVTKQPTPGIVSEKECSFILFENVTAHFRSHWEQIRTQVFLNRPERLQMPFLAVFSLRDLAHSFGTGEPVLKGVHRNVFIHHIYLSLCQHSSKRWVFIFLMEGRATRAKVPGTHNNHNVAWPLSLFAASEIAGSVKSFRWMERPRASHPSPPLPHHLGTPKTWVGFFFLPWK